MYRQAALMYGRYFREDSAESIQEYVRKVEPDFDIETWQEIDGAGGIVARYSEVEGLYYLGVKLSKDEVPYTLEQISKEKESWDSKTKDPSNELMLFINRW